MNKIDPRIEDQRYNEEGFPFDDIAEEYRSFRRQQKQKFQEYIIKHHSALATAIAEESARFDVVRRHVIEPTMHEVADLAMIRGYHVFVTTDDEMDRLALIGSPSIRFYCCREPFARPVNDLIWSPPFIAFYGCPEVHGVRSYSEILHSNENSPQSQNAIPIAYSDITQDTVRTRLLTFIDSLRMANIGSKEA